jgi:chromosome partitioning protein
VLPATDALSMAELQLSQEPGADRVLRTALEGLTGRFDFVVLDCPPNLGLVAYNALAAADGVVVPVLSTFFALQGLGRLEKTLAKVRARTNPAVRVLGYVHNVVDAREDIARETREVLRAEKGDALLGSELRVCTKQKSMPAKHLTAWDEGASPRGREDWESLLPEVLERLQVVPLRKRKVAQ